MKTKLRIKMHMKLYKNGQKVLDVTKQKKSSIYACLERVSHDRSYIRVFYLGNGWNDSEHYSDKSLKSALATYTEKPLLNFIQESEAK